MMILARKANTERAVSELVRKELGSRTNARFLARMPVFAADPDLPDEFGALLARIDEAEASTARPN